MFEKYDPSHGKMLRILDERGQVVCPEFLPDVPQERLVEALERMIYARVADLRAVSYQRQGRMYTYPPGLGQEAAAVGFGMAMGEDDWLVPAYREMGAYLVRDVRPRDMYLFWGGHEEGSRMTGAKNVLPLCVPIASQILHAVGLAFALKYRGQTSAVFVCFGEGATSQGDFHEAMNFAGVWNVPVVFVCQNNQYAISTPTSKQTAACSIAVKALAYGMLGIQVDGNDFLATYAAASQAALHVRTGGEPVLIEYVTYRLGAHTTSDDPGRYRPCAEEKEWAERDPIRRLSAYLAAKGLWRPEREKELEAKYGEELDAEFALSENVPYALDDVFGYTFAEMPEDLLRQRAEYEAFAKWKETWKWQR